LKEEMKKLGLRVRERKVAAPAAKGGKITAEEVGNRLSDDDDTGERLRDPMLDELGLNHTGLSIADETAPLPSAPVRVNPKGLRVGYNPYESGLLVKKEWKRKRDLNELSRWIEVKRKLKDKKD
jgi:hypothetical protein